MQMHRKDLTRLERFSELSYRADARAYPRRGDPHDGPVPPSAWIADRAARARGRVPIFNAVKPGGLDGWTMDACQYDLMRTHISAFVDEHADAAGSVALAQVVEAARRRFATHPAFPTGRVRNYCTFVRVDLEARCEIERLPKTSPQRIRRRDDVP